jgi:hypothetical protein
LALANTQVRLVEYWEFTTWQILSCSAAQPNTVNFAGEDLAGIEVKRYLDVPPRSQIFEIL